MNRNRSDGQFDGLPRDFPTLSPEQRGILIRRAIGRAHAYRARVIREFFKKLAGWVRRRAAIARLRRLDDRMLKDIGLNRGEIESAVLGFPRDRQPRGAVPVRTLTGSPARTDKAA